MTMQIDGAVKYTRFIDTKMNIVGFKFLLGPREKPPEEALALLRSNTVDEDGKPTGLEFKKNPYAWTGLDYSR
jgi:hypothetical protein